MKGSDYEHGTLGKADRFINNLYFKKDNYLYCFGESYLHRFDLDKNAWQEEIPFKV